MEKPLDHYFQVWSPYYQMAKCNQKTPIPKFIISADEIGAQIWFYIQDFQGSKLLNSCLMMMMMMNCFCGMVDGRKVVSLISSRDHCQRSSPSRISDTSRVGLEPAQNLSSGFVEWSCAVAITTTIQHHSLGLVVRSNVLHWIFNLCHWYTVSH